MTFVFLLTSFKKKMFKSKNNKKNIWNNICIGGSVNSQLRRLMNYFPNAYLISSCPIKPED